MMGYILLLINTCLNVGESVVVKTYSKRYGAGGMLMNAVIALFATVFFLVTDTNGWNAPAEMIPLALLNSLLFASGYYSAYVAYTCGPYGLTRLVSSFSLLFSIVYGIAFLGEDASLLTYIGIGCILVAGFLINLGDKNVGSEASGVSVKWILSVIVMVVSNGFIAVLTRMQQIRFDNTCSSEFNVISIGVSFLILTVIGLIIDHDKLSSVLKKGTLYGAIAGLFNGAKNFCSLIVYLYLPISTVSPLGTGLGIIAAFLTALLYYRERYNLRQMIGVALGTVAVIALTL